MGIYFIVLLFLIGFARSAPAVPSETNLGPLTTTFTPTSTCLDVTAIIMSGLTSAGDVRAGPAQLVDIFSIIPDPAQPCFPSYSLFVSALSIPFYRTVFFSPGVCPSGYSTAYKFTVDDETRATCCPTGYTTSDYYGFTGCASDQTAQVIASAYVVVNWSDTMSVTREPYTIPSDALLSGGFSAVPVAIRYKASDFSTLVATTNNTISATSTTVASSSLPSTSGNTISPVVSNHRLPPGTKIGIALGSAIGVIVIFGGIFAFVLRRRSQRRKAENVSGKPGELHGNSAQVHEIASAQVHELSSAQIHELRGFPIENSDHDVVLDSERSDPSKDPDSVIQVQELGSTPPSAIPPSQDLDSSGQTKILQTLSSWPPISTSHSPPSEHDTAAASTHLETMDGP